MRIFTLLAIALIPTSVLAFSAVVPETSFEDTPEFRTPLTPSIDQAETWAYGFELIRANGQNDLFAYSNLNILLKPASTMKLFTSWWAFQKSNRSDAYLSKMLHESVNQMADSTQQRMGGVLGMEDYYRDHGLELNDENFHGADGSGLSYDNLTTCQVEMDLLKMIKANKNYTRYKKLLAQPKQVGTLKTRLTVLAGRLFAKTGTLDRTASLSGFLETKKGTVIFCIMSDYLNGSIENARKKIDAMVLKKYALMK